MDVLLFDTTSTYFETEDDDEFRRYGASKDHRPDRPQTVIGLAVTREGIPVRVWSWPGNAADTTVIRQVHDELREASLHRVLWVGDRGFASEQNRVHPQRAGGHVLFPEKLRGVTDNQIALARAGRYRVVSDSLHVKEVWVGDGPSRRRFIIARNLSEAARDLATRTRHLERLKHELAALTGKTGDARLAAEGVLLAHLVLRRYLTRRHGTLTTDTKAVKAEEKLDGKYLLSCTDETSAPPTPPALQEPPRGRTLVPRPQGRPRAPPRLPPPRAADPRPHHLVLPRPDADPGRRERHEPALAGDRPHDGPDARRTVHRPCRARHPTHRDHPRATHHPARPEHPRTRDPARTTTYRPRSQPRAAPPSNTTPPRNRAFALLNAQNQAPVSLGTVEAWEKGGPVSA